MARRREAQRGAALITVAVFLALLLGITAIGIDVGRLAHTATEVQTVADAAARGGAKRLGDVGGTPGEGIERAKEIAAMNWMDGIAAPPADVLVDEGFYDFDDGTFQCCTSNTPCCEGGAPPCGGAPSSCDRVSAVLAMPHTTVNNIIAGVFNYIDGGRLSGTAAGSHQTTTVEKLAIAAPGGPAEGCQAPEGCTLGDWGCYCDAGVAPCLPIAAPSCEFPPGCTGVDCQLPQLQVSSNGSDTAGWTGFTEGSNDTTIRKFLSQGPCQPPGNSGDNVDPQMVGTDINLNNGINSAGNNNVFDLAQCLVDNNQGCGIDANGNISGRGDIFMIPIFESSSSSCDGNFVQSAPIVGFATIRITSVSLDNPRTISIETVRNVSGTETQPGGGCFGTDCRVTLVR